MCLLFGGIVCLFVGEFNFGRHNPRVLIGTLMSVGFLATGFWYLRRYRAFRFFGDSGQVVLDVIENGPQKSECVSFVESIKKAIDAARLSTDKD